MIGVRPAAAGSAILALCGLIGLELSGGGATPDAAPIRPNLVVPADGRTAAAEPPERQDVRLAAILARPLFSPDRRPAASGARSVSGLPRLSGIVLSGSHKLAIFAGSGKAIVAEEGARIGAYDVTAISDAGVTVVGPEGTTVLRPLFDPSPPPLAVKPVAMQRPEPPRPGTR